MNTLAGNIRTIRNIGDPAERFRFSLLLCLVISLPFDIIYSSVIFITFIASTLVGINKAGLRRIPSQVWLFQLVFALGLAGYAYSYHKGEAGFLLERQLSIVLLPLLLPLAMQVNRERTAVLANALTVSTVFACAYLLVKLLILVVFELNMPLRSAVSSGVFFNHQFSRPLGIHAGYLSLYVSLSVLNLVYLFNASSRLRYRLVAGLAMAILFTGLFFLASRNTIIATFVILLFVFPLFKIKNKVKYMVIAALSLGVCFLVIRTVPYLWERFSRQLISEIKPLEPGGPTALYYSAEPRIERWEGGLDLVRRSPWLGYGTGDERGMLKTEYSKRGLYISYLEAFNAHNQYLSYLIKNGIPGLLVFLLAFFYYFRLAIRTRDFLYVSFLLLLIIGFYTENILDANKGILFFAIFNTFFGYNALRTVVNKQEERLDVPVTPAGPVTRG